MWPDILRQSPAQNHDGWWWSNGITVVFFFFFFFVTYTCLHWNNVNPGWLCLHVRVAFSQWILLIDSSCCQTGTTEEEPEADCSLLLRVLDVWDERGVSRPHPARPRVSDSLRYAANILGLLRTAALLSCRVNPRWIHVQEVGHTLHHKVMGFIASVTVWISHIVFVHNFSSLLPHCPWNFCCDQLISHSAAFNSSRLHSIFWEDPQNKVEHGLECRSAQWWSNWRQISTSEIACSTLRAFSVPNRVF